MRFFLFPLKRDQVWENLSLTFTSGHPKCGGSSSHLELALLKNQLFKMLAENPNSIPRPPPPRWCQKPQVVEHCGCLGTEQVPPKGQLPWGARPGGSSSLS